MTLDQLRILGSNSGCRMFLSKPYGLEMLLVLDTFEKEDADNGIDDTFDTILLNRPRRAAFSNFVEQLVTHKYLTKSMSKKKRSKFILRASTDIQNHLNICCSLGTNHKSAQYLKA